MEEGKLDEHGLFIYQVVGKPIEVRSTIDIGDGHRTGRSFNVNELVSADLIKHARQNSRYNYSNCHDTTCTTTAYTDNENSTVDGPFVRLADHSGWLFEYKDAEKCLRRIPVEDGLWTFYVDNYPSGIALRRHPIDRPDVECEPATVYLPMQKIYCDKRVKSRYRNGTVNFYRVQGTNGWVFDKRFNSSSTNIDDRRHHQHEVADAYDYDTMLLPEEKVRTGLFAYRCLLTQGVAVRDETSISDTYCTSTIIERNQFIAVDVVRESLSSSSSSSRKSSGPFLRLTDGSGWLFEKRKSKPVFEEVRIQSGNWRFRVVNNVGIGLRRQPITSQEMMCQSDKTYDYDTILDCDRRIRALSRGSPNFYRVKGTDGWVFDTRNGQVMMKLISSRGVTDDEDEARAERYEGWSPEFVRGIVAGVDCDLEEIAYDPRGQVISFRQRSNNGNGEGGARINVYYSTKTVGTSVENTSQTGGGKTQMFLKDCSPKDLSDIMKNPRIHAGKGLLHQTSRHSPSGRGGGGKSKKDEMGMGGLTTSKKIVSTRHGLGIVVEEEDVVRNSLLECRQELEALRKKEAELLETIQGYDIQQFEAARRMRSKQKQRKVEVRMQEEATCHECGRIFSTAYERQKHYQLYHSHSKYACHECDQMFETANSLEEHKDSDGHWSIHDSYLEGI